MQTVETLTYKDGVLTLIDQTLLPVELRKIDCRDLESVWEAIKMLRVRGAPAIGIAAAYGVCVGLQTAGTNPSKEAFFRRLDEVIPYLASSRPTAVNLFWALDRMKAKAESVRAAVETGAEVFALLEAEAREIHEEDRRLCRAIGRYGAELLKDGDAFLTHCNAGGLATADYGTALAVFFAATEAGKKIHVYADETRPLLQGARLTAWELLQRGIDVTLICDNMAAMVMRQGKINGVIVGADRIASNGDTANKIGTYGVAVLAKHHGIPFYVAAPFSTFDFTLADGGGIPIEDRDPKEVSHGFGKQTAPDGVAIYNPAFDVTPAGLIAGIITEKGVIAPVDRETIRKVYE
ncbi:MAG TPA: S-methyl-5-thioribose-1-phosphate isomerase [Planctomycetaceae bacterium]|nr:S-methyl-5-thioribose-1-phosphate isomerase [Planctomycetaceae bacterium]